MAMSMSFAVWVLAISILLHAAYSTIQYWALFKITEDEFTGPPYEVLVELTLVLILSLFAGLTVPRNFRSILLDSDENRLMKTNGKTFHTRTQVTRKTISDIEWKEDMEKRLKRSELYANLALAEVEKLIESNHPPPLLPIDCDDADVTEQINVENEIVESEGYSALKVECKKALYKLRHGKVTEALKLMNGMYAKNQAYLSLIHYVNGMVCDRAATVIFDSKEKQMHLTNAVESARMAAKLSPNSIGFALFYAKLLYKRAEYEDSVRECDRALMIMDPIDPGKESFKDECQEIFAADARIEHVQNELRALLLRANNSKKAGKMTDEKDTKEKLAATAESGVPYRRR